jgi:glycosyltransferase involved in cell wall biosynthesis
VDRAISQSTPDPLTLRVSIISPYETFVLDSMPPSTPADRSPIPLALVITELEPGGAERCLVELATRLDRSRFSPIVYSLAREPNADKRLLVNRLAQAQIPTHFLGVTSAWQYFIAVGRLAEMLQREQTQIVQSFLFHANIVGTRAARTAGVPHVLTGIRVADPRWWRMSLERAATGAADRHVCVSQSVSENYRRHGFDPQKLVVIPNGIDLNPWRNATPAKLTGLGVPAGRRIILYVGRLDQQKGLDRFFRELPAVFRELPNHDAVLAGDGPQKEPLIRAARRLGIEGHVHFVGWQENIPSIVAACHVLILPSRWEGMPNVILEGMAAGKPIIAMQAEGVVELLGLAALDQSAPLGDWRSLRTRLVEVAKDDARAADLARRNEGRAQQFSIDFMIERYTRLYESLLPQ